MILILAIDRGCSGRLWGIEHENGSKGNNEPRKQQSTSNNCRDLGYRMGEGRWGSCNPTRDRSLEWSGEGSDKSYRS